MKATLRLLVLALLAVGWCLPSVAEALQDVVAAYEVLAREVDPNEGPSWPDVSIAATEP